MKGNVLWLFYESYCISHASILWKFIKWNVWTNMYITSILWKLDFTNKNSKLYIWRKEFIYKGHVSSILWVSKKLALASNIKQNYYVKFACPYQWHNQFLWQNFNLWSKMLVKFYGKQKVLDCKEGNLWDVIKTEGTNLYFSMRSLWK